MVTTLAAAAPAAPAPATEPPRPRRWPIVGLGVLLVATSVLYLSDLTNSGDANSFYAAAVKSGTESVTAWIFGSLDAGNAITVDKPPGALWLMVLSARLFGFSSFSMLLPQALLGVGTVALTWATVRRWLGEAAGLIAGAVVMLTPVAALIFRFNDPDALLVFLMTLGAYAVVRAIDAGHGRLSTTGRTARSSHSALGWFIPAALFGLIAIFVLAGRAPRTDRIRASGIVWGGWLVATALVFSFMDGTIHPYYAVVLAPAIGGLIGTAGVALWRRPDRDPARFALAGMILVTAIWGTYLMGRDADGGLSWVRWLMLGTGVLGAGVLALATGRLRRFAVAALLIGAIGASTGAAAWTVARVEATYTPTTVGGATVYDLISS